MCGRFTKVCIIIILMCAGLTASLKLIFERIRLAYINEKYFEYLFANVTRYERKGDYYINYEFISKYPFNNDVMIHLLFYEFISYWYERSFVEFHYNLCNFVNDPLIGAEFKKRGLECPVTPGKLYTFKNFTIHTDDFPNVFPFEKGLVKIETHLTDSDKTRVGEGYLYLSFKNRNKFKNSN